MSSIDPARAASLVIGNSIAELAKVTELVDRFGKAHGIPQAIINDLNLCLDELLSNAISYGYEDQQPHRIVVNLAIKNNFLIAAIEDDGKPFDPWNDAPAPPSGTLQSRKLGGLGVQFVKTLMDKVSYVRAGQKNVVRIAKQLPDGGVDGDR
jgi:anti-sigma regulatory factor (Ser/Thr protein kinase)